MDVPERWYVITSGSSACLPLINLAVDFLLNNGFRMEAPYIDGLPYLSRDEEKQVQANLVERENLSNVISDIDVKETDEESLEFLKTVRRDIDEWLAVGEVNYP